MLFHKKHHDFRKLVFALCHKLCKHHLIPYTQPLYKGKNYIQVLTFIRYMYMGRKLKKHEGCLG